MAKQIIVLGASADSLMLTVNALFWYPITTGKRTSLNGSIWPGAGQAENQAIMAGDVIEEARSFSFPTGLVASAIKAFLAQYWANRNTEIGGTGPALYAGVYNDGGSWSG